MIGVARRSGSYAQENSAHCCARHFGGSCTGMGLVWRCENISANCIRFICRKKIQIVTRLWRQDETH